jgi:hypothetical protein
VRSTVFGTYNFKKGQQIEAQPIADAFGDGTQIRELLEIARNCDSRMCVPLTRTPSGGLIRAPDTQLPCGSHSQVSSAAEARSARQVLQKLRDNYAQLENASGSGTIGMDINLEIARAGWAYDTTDFIYVGGGPDKNKPRAAGKARTKGLAKFTDERVSGRGAGICLARKHLYCWITIDLAREGSLTTNPFRSRAASCRPRCSAVRPIRRSPLPPPSSTPDPGPLSRAWVDGLALSFPCGGPAGLRVWAPRRSRR